MTIFEKLRNPNIDTDDIDLFEYLELFRGTAKDDMDDLIDSLKRLERTDQEYYYDQSQIAIRKVKYILEHIVAKYNITKYDEI